MRRRQRLSITRVLQTTLSVFMLSALLPAYAVADDALDAHHLAEKARLTLETFAKAPEMDAFRNLIKSARGVFVAPQVIKGAFFIGGSGGSGVLVARDTLSGRWRGPAFYTLGSVNFGFQWGGTASEVVLLAMTERGVNALLESSIKLGTDVGIAAGPYGMGAAASTANLSVDILSFSRSKGLFAGISLDGAWVKTRSDWNNAYYGTIVTPTDIFRKRMAMSPRALGLLEEVARLSGGGWPTRPGSDRHEKAPDEAPGPAEPPGPAE